jgi:hypothetical protein
MRQPDASKSSASPHATQETRTAFACEAEGTAQRLLHLFASDRTARISPMHYNGAGDWLKPIECIQNKALIIGVFVPLELGTCSTAVPLARRSQGSTKMRPTCTANARHRLGSAALHLKP